MGMTIEEAERELVYKALVSLGMEVKEMRSMISQFFERLNGYIREGVAYEPVNPGAMMPILNHWMNWSARRSKRHWINSVATGARLRGC